MSTTVPPETTTPKASASQAINHASATKLQEFIAQRQATQVAVPEPAAEAQLAAPAPDAPQTGTDAPNPGTPPIHHSHEQPRDDAGRFALGQPPDDGGQAAVPTEDAEPGAADDAALVASESDDTAPAAEVPVVTLPEVPGRFSAREIEIDDPTVAEQLRYLANNGVRREELNKQMEAINRERVEFRQFQATLRAAPETVVDHMSPEIRQRTLQYLLAQDFETVRPVVERWYNDAAALREAQLDFREQRTQSQEELDRILAAEREEAQIMAAVRALVPPHATVEDEQDFVRDAEAALIAHVRAGQAVTTENVAALLERTRRRYGFHADAPPTAPSVTSPTEPSVHARPVGDKAQALEKARRAQARLKQAAQTRPAAAAVAPAGTGAVPAAKPKPPVGQGIEKASLWIKQNAHLFTRGDRS